MVSGSSTRKDDRSRTHSGAGDGRGTAINDEVVRSTGTRIRPIRWTKAVNDMCGPDSCPRVNFLSRQLVHAFRQGNRRFVATRLMVFVAVEATRRLLSFPLPAGVQVDDCIDNVRFCGPKDGVLAAAEIFVRRCREVGATLNEVPAEVDIRTALEGLVHQQGDWLGVTMDYLRKRVRLGPKVVEKVIWMTEHLKEESVIPARMLAAIFGLLLFSSSVLDLNMSSRFVPLQFLRRFSSDVTNDPSKWEMDVMIPQRTKEELVGWCEAAARNRWEEVLNLEGQPDKILFCDASGWGWGCVCFDTVSGMIETVGQEWTARDGVDRELSVETEPMGVYMSLVRFASMTARPGIWWVITDSVTAMSIVNAGYSSSWRSNRFAQLLRAFKHLTIVAKKVEGEMNPADGLSRGRYDGGDLGSACRQVLGALAPS